MCTTVAGADATVGGQTYGPSMAVTAERAFEMTDRHCLILEIEAPRWKYLGAKENAIREQLDMSLTEYSQALNHMLDQPEALAYAPQLVNRLRRLRDQRRRVR